MKESRFDVGPNGETKDKMHYVVNKFEDVKNLCGSQFDPDTNDYWDLMKDSLKEFSEKEMDYLFDRYYHPSIEISAAENCKKILDTLRSIWAERSEQRTKKQGKEQKRTNPGAKDELIDAAKKAFKDSDFKNIY